MAVKFGFNHVHSPETEELEMPSHAVETFARTLDILSDLAAPKNFVYTGSQLRRMEQMSSDESQHKVRCVQPAYPAIDEIVEWQVLGKIGDKTVNVICCSIFHTYIGNRSGSRETTINGKEPGLWEELGGLTLDDIWQDSNKWKEVLSDDSKVSERR